MSNKMHTQVTAADVKAGDLIWWKSMGKMTRNRVSSTTTLDSLVGLTVTLEFADGSGLNTRTDTTVWIHHS